MVDVKGERDMEGFNRQNMSAGSGRWQGSGGVGVSCGSTHEIGAGNELALRGHAT